jgi:hypothetical protein
MVLARSEMGKLEDKHEDGRAEDPGECRSELR